MAIERHFFPGNNTPKGFFSYYGYILSQQEANRIYCIKGGPGVGKSSFMKSIAQVFTNEGEDIDYLHCSSDPNSLDGIVLKKRKVSFIDATAPHVIDPVTPGAVDSIIHLGDFWNEEGIRKNRAAVIAKNEEYKKWFGRAYYYLRASENMHELLNSIYDEALEKAELYKITAQIVSEELTHKEISLNLGKVKKFFASAITPLGNINYLSTLVDNVDKIYRFKVPEGYSASEILRIFSEGAVFRGFNVEEYYCPIKPETKIEHLIIPKLRLAFVTENRFHKLTFANNCKDKQSILFDLSEIMDMNHIRRNLTLVEATLFYMEEMLRKTVKCIENAKREHDILEKFYIPNMDFKKIDTLRDEIIGKLL